MIHFSMNGFMQRWKFRFLSFINFTNKMENLTSWRYQGAKQIDTDPNFA